MLSTAAVAAVLALTLTACGSDEPDPAACEQAMRKQFAEAMESGKEGRRPAECKGVPDKELERIAGKVIGEQFGQ